MSIDLVNVTSSCLPVQMRRGELCYLWDFALTFRVVAVRPVAARRWPFVTFWSRLRRSSLRPGPGARAWRGLQHMDVAPGPDGGSSSGTFYGSHCLTMDGLIRVGCSPLAVGRFRPSQWRRGVSTVPW
jgi:hypothetical protein